KYAYGFSEQQIAGGPEWLKTQKFDIVGDPETQTRPSSDDFKQMVQNLLADRFRLVAHYETRDLSVFEIVPVKSGPKLTESTRPPDGIPTVGYAPGQLAVANATLSDFARFLQRFVADRPVIDRTGITGKFDLTLRWLPDELQTEGNRQVENSNNSLPGLFTAIQEQLGLKLQERKSPAPVFVIDHIDPPSEN
ncbi:MAG TPA: TIGR03435 family protein, partial [Acidobacteriaceae bacterium]|nr:TIGR03435 family protein [Acidobacteriaceae bacterium]